MITGYITAEREAVVPITLRGAGGVEMEVEATVDTGFNDFLVLPPDVMTALGFPYVDTSSAILADGMLVRFDVHRATLVWEGQRRTVAAQASEGGALIGMSLLYGNTVTLEVIDGGGV